ncbi:unnamed protein product [Urochloa humidicola]
MASPCRAALCLALFLVVLPLQERSPTTTPARRTPSRSASVLSTPTPTQFILAPWFRLAGVDGGAANCIRSRSSSPAPLQSVVWFAKKADTGATPLATAQSAISVTPAGQLVIADGSDAVLWSSPVNSSLKRASVLTLLDSGGDGVLWQSIKHPRDTLLPGQSVARNAGATGKSSYPSAPIGRCGVLFTTRRFSLGVQADGDVVLLVGNDPAAKALIKVQTIEPPD